MKLLYLLLCVPIVLVAQERAETDFEVETTPTTSTHQMANFLSATAGAQIYEFATPYEGLQGNPYLFEELRNAELVTAEKAVIKDVFIRYNLQLGCVEYTKDGQPINIHNNQLRSFKIYDTEQRKYRTFYNHYGYIPGATDVAFFERLYDGNMIRLLRRVRKDIFQSATSSRTPGINSNQVTRSYSKPLYTNYLVVSERIYPLTKLNKKYILENFTPNQQQLLEKLAKRYDLGWREVDDLATLFEKFEARN